MKDINVLQILTAVLLVVYIFYKEVFPHIIAWIKLKVEDFNPDPSFCPGSTSDPEEKWSEDGWTIDEGKRTVTCKNPYFTWEAFVTAIFLFQEEVLAVQLFKKEGPSKVAFPDYNLTYRDKTFKKYVSKRGFNAVIKPNKD